MTLAVRDLVAGPRGKPVLRGITLDIRRGEVIALMGPNGSGKSTLAYTVAGHPDYEVLSGKVLLENEDITKLPPNERARRGLLLGFQNPPEIPGVRLLNFLAAAYSKIRDAEARLVTSPRPELVKRLRELSAKLGLPENILGREVNLGFSGGERKRAELLQILVLEPRYVILDEPDSGLDVDGVKVVANVVKQLVEKGVGILLITHYARVLEFIEPSQVLVMVNGVIVDRGGAELVKRIEETGYSPYIEKL